VEAYLDIVEVEVVQSGIEYSARLKMNGPLPSNLSDPTIFIEWGLLVDIDQKPGTHPWGSWPLLDNGIGVDLLIRLILGPSGQGYRAEVFNAATRKSVRISFNIDGATVQLKFDDTSLGTVPKAFDFVFETRKFGNYGASGAEIACDKAPNEGYFTFGGGILRPASTQTTTTSLGTATAPTPHFGFLDMSMLLQIGGVAATGGAGFLGWFLKTRKRRFVSGYLMKVDSTYNQYSMNREECRKRLQQMKAEAILLLKRGRIDEPHFTLIDNKLTGYLKDLEQG